MPHYLHLSSTEEQCMRENNLIQPKMSCLYLLIEPKALRCRPWRLSNCPSAEQNGARAPWDSHPETPPTPSSFV